MPFTHAQHSGRFSAQTSLPQHQTLHIIQAIGGGAGCSRQRQEVTYQLCGFVYSTPTPPSAPKPSKPLDIFGGVFFLCDSAFLPGDIFFLLVLESHILTFAFTHAPLPEKIRRIRRVQCMSESSSMLANSLHTGLH